MLHGERSLRGHLLQPDARGVLPEGRRVCHRLPGVHCASFVLYIDCDHLSVTGCVDQVSAGENFMHMLGVALCFQRI